MKICFPTTNLREGTNYNFMQKDKNRNMEIHTNLWAKDAKFDEEKSSMCESLIAPIAPNVKIVIAKNGIRESVHWDKYDKIGQGSALLWLAEMTIASNKQLPTRVTSQK